MTETLDDIAGHASPCMHIRNYRVTCCGELPLVPRFMGTDPCVITALECQSCGRLLPVSMGRVMPPESRA